MLVGFVTAESIFRTKTSAAASCDPITTVMTFPLAEQELTEGFGKGASYRPQKEELTKQLLVRNDFAYKAARATS